MGLTLGDFTRRPSLASRRRSPSQAHLGCNRQELDAPEFPGDSLEPLTRICAQKEPSGLPGASLDLSSNISNSCGLVSVRWRPTNIESTPPFKAGTFHPAHFHPRRSPLYRTIYLITSAAFPYSSPSRLEIHITQHITIHLQQHRYPTLSHYCRCQH
jgi:hypothetical protein